MSTMQPVPLEPLLDLRLKILRWIFFNVCFGLLPVGVNGLIAATRNQETVYAALTGRGELLLIAAAISAAAAGEVLGRPMIRLHSTALVFGALNLVIVFMAALWYADISAGLRANEHIDLHLVSTYSTGIIISSLIFSACCVVVAEMCQS